MVEEWRTVIVDGEVYDNYEVSNMGNVRSLKGKIKLLKPHSVGGYLQISLCKNGKRKYHYIHRLVALMFIENDEPTVKTEVNHISEVKTENTVENLEWCSPKQNANHGTRTERSAKARSKRVRCIETDVVYESTKDVERKTGLLCGNISNCCNGKRKTYGNLHWEWA